jgi:sugar phosphate permease
MSILSGYLISSVGWRWMFIIEGVPAIVWAFLWWRLIDNNPKDAKWLRDDEKNALNKILSEEQQVIEPVKNYAVAFRSRKVILLCIQYALWNLGVFGFVMWLPSIINAARNHDIVATGWLASVPYVLAIIAMLGASYFSDKTLNRKIFVWPFLLVGAIAFYSSYLIGPNHFWISFVLLVIAGGAIYAPYGPFFAIITEILPQNVSGGAIALINSFGALGSFAGAYIVGYLNGVTGGFNASYIFMAGSLFISAVITIFAVKGTKVSVETSRNKKQMVLS